MCGWEFQQGGNQMHHTPQDIYNHHLMEHFNSFFRRHNLRPFMTVYLAAVHCLALIGFLYSLFHPSTILTVLAVHVVFHMLWALGITAGAHRLWAHKCYVASAPLRFFLMLLCSGANQGSVFHWARDHRLHHKFSDTELDPHSMQKGMFYAHMGWLLRPKDPKLVAEGTRIDVTDMQRDAALGFQRRFNWFLTPFMCYVLPALVFRGYTGANWAVCLCLALMPYVTMLHATWCVNSICHRFGSRPWNGSIAPADNVWVSLITNGQGYHNWHHEYPSDWRASKDHWYMLNLTARFLEICAALRLCKLKQ